MSPTYLVEHAEAARIALDLAEREAAHLRYTCATPTTRFLASRLIGPGLKG